MIAVLADDQEMIEFIYNDLLTISYHYKDWYMSSFCYYKLKQYEKSFKIIFRFCLSPEERLLYLVSNYTNISCPVSKQDYQIRKSILVNIKINSQLEYLMFMSPELHF